jgi:hypothetical protein
MGKKRQRCKEEGCTKRPSFNIKGNISGIYCLEHKKDNMVDIVHKNCIEEGCTKRPNFNLSNEKTAIYCVKHKKENMINILEKRKCNNYGCNIQPRFNYENENKGLYCAKHKKENMVDVINNRCNEIGCSKQPSYNYINKTKAEYCYTHKKVNMVNIVSPICKYIGCNTQPSFNYKGSKKAIYCRLHKLEEMIDVIHKKCKTELCNTIPSNNRYEGYCLRCFVYLFPDKPNSHNYKTKESSVVEYIQKEFQNKTIITDKKIQDGCSRRRPDILIDLGYQVIIVEIDENQHVDYDCSCENKRIMELSQDVGHRPLIFIRFNPDEYLDKENNKITSCWGIDKRGICSIKKSKTKEWNERLNILKEQIQYWIDNESSKTVEIFQLFYDQNISI